MEVNSMERELSKQDLTQLRQAGLLAMDEIAITVGDVVIAENVVSKERRVLEVRHLMLETNKRLLKD
jgi:hypothetical protein